MRFHYNKDKLLNGKGSTSSPVRVSLAVGERQRARFARATCLLALAGMCVCDPLRTISSTDQATEACEQCRSKFAGRA